jgi:hypothetical protein
MSQPSRPDFMEPDEFNRLFTLVLTDSKFRAELRKEGFSAIEKRGFKVQVPRETRDMLDKALLPLVSRGASSNCGVCGICGLCGGCSAVNFGSFSAALWATFHFGLGFTSSQPARP